MNLRLARDIGDFINKTKTTNQTKQRPSAVTLPRRWRQKDHFCLCTEHPSGKTEGFLTKDGGGGGVTALSARKLGI